MMNTTPIVVYVMVVLPMGTLLTWLLWLSIGSLLEARKTRPKKEPKKWGARVDPWHSEDVKKLKEYQPKLDPAYSQKVRQMRQDYQVANKPVEDIISQARSRQ